jgi:hypothetical protein
MFGGSCALHVGGYTVSQQSCRPTAIELGVCEVECQCSMHCWMCLPAKLYAHKDLESNRRAWWHNTSHAQGLSSSLRWLAATQCYPNSTSLLITYGRIGRCVHSDTRNSYTHQECCYFRMLCMLCMFECTTCLLSILRVCPPSVCCACVPCAAEHRTLCVQECGRRVRLLHSQCTMQARVITAD